MLSVLFLAATAHAYEYDPTEEPTSMPSIMVPLTLTDGVPDGYMKVGDGVCTEVPGDRTVDPSFSTPGECARVCNEKFSCDFFAVKAGDHCIYFSSADVGECGCADGFTEKADYEAFKAAYRWEGTTINVGKALNNQMGSHTEMSADGTVVAVREAHLTETANGMDGDAGQIHVYQMGATGWEQMGDVVRGPDHADGKFGYTGMKLNNNGNYMAVASSYATGGAGTQAGKVEVFKWEESSWSRVGDAIYGPQSFRHFGDRVALSDDGSVLVTGSFKLANLAGLIQVYEWSGENWVQKGTDLIGASTRGGHGNEIDLNAAGTRLAISALAAPDGKWNGVVKIYDWDGSDWEETWEIVGDNQADSLGRGLSLSADGKTVAIGILLGDKNTLHDNWGSVKVYQESTTGSWTQKGDTIYGPPKVEFGNPVTMSADGSTLLVSAYRWNKGDGMLRVLKYTDSNWKAIGDFKDETSNRLGDNMSGINADGSKIIIGYQESTVNGLRYAGRAIVWEWTEKEATDVSDCGTSPTESQIEGLQAQISNLETENSGLKADKQSLASQVNNLNTQVNNLNTQVNNLNTQVNNLSTQVNNLNTENTQLKTENNELKGELTCEAPDEWNGESKTCEPASTNCVYIGHGTINNNIIRINGSKKKVEASAEACHNFCKDNSDAIVFTFKSNGGWCQCKMPVTNFQFFGNEDRTSGYIVRDGAYNGQACPPLTSQ